MTSDKSRWDLLTESQNPLEGVSDQDIDLLAGLVGYVGPFESNNLEPSLIHIDEGAKDQVEPSPKKKLTTSQHKIADSPGCRICGDKIGKKGRKRQLCSACHQFYNERKVGHLKIPQACTLGTNNCTMTRETRLKCPFCRLEKLYSIGMPKLSPKETVSRSTGPKSTTRERPEAPNIAPTKRARSVSPQQDQSKRSALVVTIEDESCESAQYSPPREEDYSDSDKPETIINKDNTDKLCQTCGDTDEVCFPRGITTCKSCYHFGYNRQTDHCAWPTECITRLNKCEINLATRNDCRYCRMQKMISLGVIDNKDKVLTRAADRTLCQVCGDTQKVAPDSGVWICYSCRCCVKCLREASSWPIICRRKLGKCKITKETRGSCKFCRMIKMDKLGLLKSKATCGKTSGADNNVEEAKSCTICGDTGEKFIHRGVLTCKGCYNFIRVRENGLSSWPSRCKEGDNKCIITIATRTYCHYCRALKMKSLGMIEHQFEVNSSEA